MTIAVVRRSAWRPTAWKNGGGTTSEIWVHPRGASLDDFLWRVSAARVQADGPFSLFAGVDRTLTLLEGIELDLQGEQFGSIMLTETSAPFTFAADGAVQGRLPNGGAVLDFNVMSRRGHIRHSVEAIVLAGVLSRPASAGFHIVLCRTGSLFISCETQTITLDKYDTAMIEPGREFSMQGDGSAALVVQLSA
ncbi:MAG TPA: HutD family protein [Devosia sp.]|nr:HutD family protein [Devosia sp.]